MNLGLLHRAAREALGLTMLCGLGIFLFQLLFALLTPVLAQDFSDQFLKTRMSRFFLSAMLGAEIDSAGPSLFAAIAWTHPVQLTLIFWHAIASATRVPAAEVERGTIDLLLGWPVSRWQVFAAELAVFALSSALIVLVALGGSRLGLWLSGASDGPGLSSACAIALNLYALCLALGGLAWLCSAGAERRGRAIATPVVLVLVSMLINFLAPVWEPAKSLSFLSVLHYYQPFASFARGAWPFGEVAVLLAFAVVTSALAALWFQRRDLRAG
ncbi:MAG: ABC transporter permease subunit [Planctomycetes bacterium]|nr:ABC transporter permease subunit [Planctomycetota bacterium]